MYHRRLDEQAAKQREREAEIEAKLAAKRAGVRAPPPPERTITPEAAPAAVPAAGGPPRLNLQGSRPSWREREAAKGDGPSTQAAPAEAPAAAESSEAPRRSGYVPPALRNASPATGAAGGWRAREGSGRGAAPPLRSESPATAAEGGRGGSRYAPPAARGIGMERGGSARGQEASGAGGQRSGYVPPHLREGRSGSNDGSETSERSEPSGGAPAPGRYRPGAFSKRRENQ